MLSERLEVDRKIDLFINKEPSCRELRETLKSVEIQRRRFLKDIDNSMNRFKAKYGGHIHHAAASRRRSVHSISSSDSIEAFNRRNSMTDRDHVRHSFDSEAGTVLPRRRHSDQPESINKQVQGKLLYRRKSSINHGDLGFRENDITVSKTMDSYKSASEPPRSSTEKDETKEQCSGKHKLKIIKPILSNTRRHSEPEFSEIRNVDVVGKVTYRSETGNLSKLFVSEDDKENENIGNENEVALPSSRLTPADDVAEKQDVGENDELKEMQTMSNETSKWARVKKLTVKDVERKSSLFDVSLKICPKIKKHVEFKDQEIFQKTAEEIKPKWQLLRRKSLLAEKLSGPERVSVNVLETICPKMENNELEMNTLKSLLNFRKGHKKVEIVARLLSDHIRTDVEPSLNLKEGAWMAALSSCRYLR